MLRANHMLAWLLQSNGAKRPHVLLDTGSPGPCCPVSAGDELGLLRKLGQLITISSSLCHHAVIRTQHDRSVVNDLQVPVQNNWTLIDRFCEYGQATWTTMESTNPLFMP
jgi:hypothetical protein